MKRKPKRIRAAVQLQGSRARGQQHQRGARRNVEQQVGDNEFVHGNFLFRSHGGLVRAGVYYCGDV